MVQLTLIVLICAANAVLSKSVLRSSKEFIHIGSFKSSGSRVRRAVGDVFDEHDYYMNDETAKWSEAQADCKNIFGSDASTVAIESKEEWNFLREELEKAGGSTYWTSGMYDTPNDVWRWSANDNPLPPFAPWGIGYPGKPNAKLRVLLFQTNRYSAEWRTASDTVKHRYICEVQKTTIAVPCYKTNDLIVVLDSSKSITLPHYETAKSFVEKLAAAFTVHSPSRIGFSIYSDNNETIFNIQNTYTPAVISSEILNAKYLNSQTATWLGVNSAINEFQSSPRDVPLNLVVLTDGDSGDKALTIASANLATSKGIRSFAVGIGGKINQEELEALAGGNSDRIYYADNFDELIQILAPLSRKVCPTE